MKSKEFSFEGKKTRLTMPKRRDPNWQTMQAKATSGAGGEHKDRKRAEKQGDVKHRKDLIPMESISEISGDMRDKLSQMRSSTQDRLSAIRSGSRDTLDKLRSRTPATAPSKPAPAAGPRSPQVGDTIEFGKIMGSDKKKGTVTNVEGPIVTVKTDKGEEQIHLQNKSLSYSVIPESIGEDDNVYKQKTPFGYVTHHGLRAKAERNIDKYGDPYGPSKADIKGRDSRTAALHRKQDKEWDKERGQKGPYVVPSMRYSDIDSPKDFDDSDDDSFAKVLDWYKNATPEQRRDLENHPAFQDHPEQLEKLKSAAGVNEDDGVAASPRLQRAHERERQRRGLPHPDEYLQMIEKKKKEIDAMRAQDLAKDVKEAQDPDEGYMDRVISDLHKDARGFRPDQEWGNWWMSLTYKEKLKIFNDMVDELGESIKEASDWGEPGELLTDVLTALERQVEWPLTDVMDRREVQSLLQPVRDAVNAKMKTVGQGVQEGGGDTHLKRLELDVRQLAAMGDYDAAEEHAALAPTDKLKTDLRKIILRAMSGRKSKQRGNIDIANKQRRSRESIKQYVAQQMEDEYGDGDITFHRDYAGGYNVHHTNDAGEIHSHQYDPRTGKVYLRNIVRSNEERVSEDQTMSIQDLATISDEALDKAYGYGRSTPGNTFGWQANLMSAAYAKKIIDAGVTDIEKISDAIHKGWNVTAQKFVQDPDQFDDTEKLRQSGKLEAKLQQRAKLMKINYAQLDNDEQEKDRVVARALLQAIKGQQDVSEVTRDMAFDRMLSNIKQGAKDYAFDRMIKSIKQGTKKQARADRRERDAASRERARAAFGPSPADQLSIRPDQGVAEGLFGLSAKEKGKIQYVTAKISDIPGNWDHKNQQYTEQGLKDLKSVMKNEKYLKYALSLTADDYEAEGVAEGSEPELGTVKANLMNTQEPTVQVQVFKHNTLRGDSYWVTKEVKKFRTMDQAQAYIDRINKQGVAEGGDDWGSMSHGEFKRRELQHELGHETNNVSIDINGKPWKVLKGESENPQRALARAEKIAATIKRNALAKGRKEPKVDVYVTGAPATE